jgi:hypothetical protein
LAIALLRNVSLIPHGHKVLELYIGVVVTDLVLFIIITWYNKVDWMELSQGAKAVSSYMKNLRDYLKKAQLVT